MGRKKLVQPWAKRTPNSSRAKEDSDEGVFQPFSERLPEIADRETRHITVVEQDGPVPPGHYVFTEGFCAGKRCDCRRVMFFVHRAELGAPIEHARHISTIGFGWEPLSFYVEWMYGDVEGARHMRGPVIEPNSPIFGQDRALLRMFERTCLSSKEYVARVRAHYKLFKGHRAAIAG